MVCVIPYRKRDSQAQDLKNSPESHHKNHTYHITESQ
jgi:hypothetical protein